VDLASVRGALRSDEILLEYFVTADRLLIFVVTRDSVVPMAVNVGSEQIVSRTRLARELLGRRDARPGAAYAALGSLYTSLIAPVRRASLLDGANRLIIVPHGALAYLPFAALRNPADGRFLVQNFTTMYVPSSAAFRARSTSGARSRAEARTGPRRRLLHFPRELPATLVEAQRVSQLLEGIAVTGAEASEMAFRRALETAPLVHVATHAELNTQNPMFSSIALTSTRHWGPKQRRSPRRSTNCSGCTFAARSCSCPAAKTGVGAAWSSSFRQGEDFTTLAQAFLYAGARSVVATLWRIEDGAAATFAQQFYENLRRMPPSDALAAAQRSMLANPKYASP
jgi:CHAT domain-containing protein